MDILKTFRHEFKYHINKSEMYNIRDKLQDVMKIDRNKNGYLVRSLYFDSINDVDYYDKLAGSHTRKKIRLRIYEDNPTFAKLELKGKYDIHQLKESLVIDRAIAENIVKGNYSVLLEIDNPLAFKIYDIMVSNCYRPKCIIEYERIAFIAHTTTRITMDYNIKKSNDVERFFDGNINFVNLISDNEAVLEVKFDRFLEPHISSILSGSVSNNESVSKYVMGRNS